jgi:spermidine synthase
MFPAYLLAFFTGFLSLSQEILWVRLFSFANYSLPQAFAFVLILYLIGIAIGAAIGKRFCDRAANLWLVSGIVLVVSGCFDMISPWIYAMYSQTTWQISCGGLLILITALFKSIIFPIAHHLGTPQQESLVGRKVSRVYAANIAGATLGPIFTGMLFLDIFTTQQCYMIFAMLAILVGLYCLIGYAERRVLLMSSAFSVAMLGFMFLQEPSLLIAKVAGGQDDLLEVVENSHGIVTLYKQNKGGDIVFGGNVYDGRTNLDPVVNSNGLNRLIILSALFQRPPEHILMIGLSIGSWLKIITSFPGVKHIDVVEINPGYLTAMKRYPAQESALHDPRVRLYIDDGRRWLKAHPDNQYDLIIMNTTFYWRAYTSNLLSADFLQLIKQHMKPQAILTYNTTYSPDALATAAHIFSHAYLYENFVVAAAFDWREHLHDAAAIQKIAALSLDGHLLFPAGSEKVIKAFLMEKTVPVAELQDFYKKMRSRHLEVITDRNLITEYKYGHRLFDPERRI